VRLWLGWTNWLFHISRNKPNQLACYTYRKTVLSPMLA
jgi:hypothetical protein